MQSKITDYTPLHAHNARGILHTRGHFTQTLYLGFEHHYSGTEISSMPTWALVRTHSAENKSET